jgi:hypothetical protein
VKTADMDQNELEKIWWTVRQQLNSTRSLLSPEIVANVNVQLEIYEEMLDHNELELALDLLEEIGEQNLCPNEVTRNPSDVL